MSVLELITLGSVALFFGFYVLYFLICLRYSRLPAKKLVSSFTEEELPNVSVIVPIYNEKNMIESKIENFKRLNYPMNKIEVVLVDGGSNDGTLEEIDRCRNNLLLRLKVVKQGSRKGFNSAVIEGFSQTSGDIIFITGAETEYDPNAVRLIVNHFADSKVGAVNGTMRISNLGEGASTKIEASYRGFYDFLRQAESNMDSPFDIKGEIVAGRRDVVQNLVNNAALSRRGCIDCCFSFQAKQDGYATVYEPNAFYYEPAPRTMRDSFKQQIRRGATLIENMMTFKNLILKLKYRKFGMVIMPAHFLMLVILPLLFLFSTVGILLITLFNPMNSFLIAFVILGFLLVGFSRRLQAFVKTQIVLIFALLKLLFGIDTQKFERLRSVRHSGS